MTLDEGPGDDECEDPERPPAGDNDGAKSDISSILLQVLAAFGTGIGILGFVVFFGAAILWIRYDKAGLPADEAVAVVPKPTLLTTGAEFLAPALLVALASVLVLLVIDVLLRNRQTLRTVTAREEKAKRARTEAEERWGAYSNARRQAVSAVRKRSAERIDPNASPLALWLAEWDAEKAVIKAQKAKPAARRAERVVENTEEGLRTATDSDLVKSVDDVLDRDDFKAEFRVTAVYISLVLIVELIVIGGSALEIGVWRTLLLIAAMGLFALVNWYLLVHILQQRLPRRLAWQIIVMLVAAILSIVAIVFLARKLGTWSHLGATTVLVIVALITAAISWLVYQRTRRLVVLGVATFLSVGVFAGAATYSRTVNNLKLEAAAVLRKSQGPITGVYVAQTSTRFYLAVGVIDGSESNHPRLVAIPAENVADFAIKDLASVARARLQADKLAERLCRERDHELVSGAGSAEAAACTRKQERALAVHRQLRARRLRDPLSEHR